MGQLPCGLSHRECQSQVGPKKRDPNANPNPSFGTYDVYHFDNKICHSHGGFWSDINGGTCIIAAESHGASTNTASRSVDGTFGGAGHLSITAPTFSVGACLLLMLLVTLGLAGVAVKAIKMRGNAKRRRGLVAAKMEDEYEDFVDEKVAKRQVREEV